MFRNRSFLFFGLAGVLALVTAIMAYNWFQDQKPVPVVKKVVQSEGIPIAVASVDIPWGVPLTKEMFRLVDYPKAHLPEGKFEKLEDLNGRIVLTHLKRNEPILESKLAPTDIKTGGVVGVMHPGMRAIAVAVNNVVGLPGFVKPGDRVDIMATLKGKKGKITKTVLENTLVLATGTQMERKGPGEKPRPVKVITFEVSLPEAEKLALASIEGKLRLALRSPINTEPELTKGATTQSLLASFQAYSKPSYVKRKKAKKDTNKVELITGSSRKFLKF